LSGTDPIRVLVTRPLPQGERTAARLTEMGYTPILAPMLRIVPVTPADPPDFAALQAVLVTSANGADRLAALTPLRTMPLLTVGDRTAKTAKKLGFQSIASAHGDGKALLELARRTLDPAAGPVIHIRGRDAAVSFEALSEAGFDFRELITYEAVPVPDLPPEAYISPPAAALVYSARTAAALVEALRASALDPARITFIGISTAALAPLTALNAEVIASETPDETAILAALSTSFPATIKK